jgi:hypothetical protein
MSKQVARYGQRDRRFAGAAAACRKTPFYFNELSEEINGKISSPGRPRREQPYLKATESSMNLLSSQNDQ